MNKKLAVSLAALAALSGCKKEEPAKTSIQSSDTSIVQVVAVPVVPVPFQDRASYTADLRGTDDAVLVTTASGVIRTVANVGSHVEANQSLCDIESDRYLAQLNAVKAQMDAAKNQLDLAKKNVDAGSVGKIALDAPTTQYYSAQSSYLNAKKQYDDSRCLAPFPGIIASRSVERFQTVGAGTATYRLVRQDVLDAVFSIPESEIQGVQPGMSADFYLLDAPQKLYSGRLTAVDGAADAKNRVMTARLSITNRGGALKPGMVGRVALLRRSYARAIAVPSASLLRSERGVTAMVVVGGRAHEVSVRLGSGQGDSVLVLSGIKAGDTLVVQGAAQVSEGTRVKF
jgi:membrane fusion protein (multidrug efflux system)